MDVRPLDPSSDRPPYEQLRVQIASRAASGELPGGTRLPTVRALATQLRLAVNTVARAYKELESDGVVVTEGRRGTFVSPSVAGDSADAHRAAGDYASACRRLGLSMPEAQRLVERAW